MAKKHKPKKASKKAKPKAAPVPKQVVVPRFSDEKAFEMVRAARIPVVPYMFIKKVEDLPVALKKLGFPAVLKVSGERIVHKSDVGGVVKNVNTLPEAEEAFKKLMKIRGAEKVAVQKQLSGFELIIGAKSDPQFGEIISVGIGGVYAEVMKDVAFRVCPIIINDAVAMVKELKGFEIIAGARGEKPVKFEALYDVLMKVSSFAAKNRVKEMDLNPLICSNEGCWAVDVRIMK